LALPSAPASASPERTDMEWLSPKDAGAVMKYARRLLQTGTISRSALVVMDCLTFNCRKPGQPSVRASLSLLQRLTHSARQTVVDALAELCAAGLLIKRTHRVLVAWAHGGSTWRQATNEYEIAVPDRESSRCPVSTGKQVSKEAREGEAAALAGMLRAAAGLPDLLAKRREYWQGRMT
jgi:hypothetical protein